MCCQIVIDVDNERKRRFYAALGEPCLCNKAFRFEVANLYEQFSLSEENVDNV